MLDCYTLLNIKKTATQDEIKAAFHTKAMQYHPDKLQKIIKKSGKTENEINIIKRIYTDKYNNIKQAYTTLSEGREEYDKYLLEKSHTSILSYELEPSFQIEKIDLVNKYDSEEFNKLFALKNKKEDNINTQISLNKAFEQRLAERENSDIFDYSYEKFDIKTFNDNFFSGEEDEVISSDLAIWSPDSTYGYKDKYELTEPDIIKTDNAVDMKDIIAPVKHIIDNRKIINLSSLTSSDLEYVDYVNVNYEPLLPLSSMHYA